MKIALECPIELMDEVQPLADFDFILAHVILRKGEYASYYMKTGRMRILDNSCNELLRPCSISELKEAADIVKPDYIIAPDYLGDHFSTERALDEAITIFGKEKIFPVIQGSELRYALECASYIIDKGFDRVAVPYDITCSRGDSIESMASKRARVTKELLPHFEWIHLLGMTTLEELESYKYMDSIESIDTGSPILNGISGIRFGRDELLNKSTPTYNLMEVAPRFDSADIFFNIAYLRKVLNAD